MRIPTVLVMAVLSALVSLPPTSAAEDELIGARSATFAANLVQGVVGLTFDQDGYMYVATHGNGPADIGKFGVKAIMRISPDGTRSIVANYQCFAFQYLKYKKDGSILASVVRDAEGAGNEVVRITKDGQVSTFADGFVQPGGITFDALGNVYVVDAETNTVYKIDASNHKSTFIDINASAHVTSKIYFHGLEFDASSNCLYLVGLSATQARGKILKYPVGKDGSPGVPVLVAESVTPLHVTLDGKGNAFATVNKNSILYIRENGTAQEFQCQGSLFDGYALEFGGKGFDETSLYINAFDKIIKVDFLRVAGELPDTLIFPRLVQTAKESIGLAVVNHGPDSTQLTFTAYDNTGNLISSALPGRNPATVTLPPGEQFVAVAPELLGETLSTEGGWLRMTTERKNVAGFFLAFDPTLLTMDGTDVNGSIFTSLVFPEAAGGEISLLNVDESRQADVAIRLYDDQGVAQGTPVYQVIAPRARFAASTTQLFPSLAAGTSGYLSVTSAPGLAGLMFATKSGMYSWALQAANGNGGAKTLYSPQFVTGFGYRSSLTLVNLEILPANVAVRWINDSGDAVGQPATFTVPAKGRKVVSDPAIFQAGPSNSGYIIVESDRLLTGAVFFGDEAGTRMQTALPLVTLGLKDIIYSQVAQNDVYYTGLAVINPGAAEAHLSILVYDEHGAEKGSGSETLGPGSRFSKLLTQIAPGAPAMSKGYFRVKSDQPVFSFAVFGTTTFSVLSAIPAQPVEP
jgi:DNA-binding beta-propeller fold protein YncE